MGMQGFTETTTNTDVSVSNDNYDKKRIAIIGTGPVALFLAYCLSASSKNEVIIVGREGSKTVDQIIDEGFIDINTKTIRDLHQMLDGTYEEPNTSYDPNVTVVPDISIDLPNGERAIKVGDELISKFENMGAFGGDAAQAIRSAIRADEKEHLTREELDNLIAEHFQRPFQDFYTQNLSDDFGAKSYGLRRILGTNDISGLHESCDVVITAIKAHSITRELAEDRVWPLLKPDTGQVLLAANGITPTLIPKIRDKVPRAKREETETTIKALTDALRNVDTLEEMNGFCDTLEGVGHEVLGASITFALQQGKKPNHLVFSSKVHEAYLTMQATPLLRSIFTPGVPLEDRFKEGFEYTAAVLLKLAKNQMNGVTAVLNRTKKQVIEHERFKPFYMNVVREMHDTFAAIGINIEGTSGELVSECVKFHTDSAAEGGHVSSTFVDFLKGRPTESKFIHTVLEEIADHIAREQAPQGELGKAKIPNIRVLRRSLRALEKHLVKERNQHSQTTPENIWGDISKKLRSNVVRLDPNGTTSQIRYRDVVVDNGNNERSGIYYLKVPAWSYRYGTSESTAKHLVKTRIEDGHFTPEFQAQLMSQYYDEETQEVSDIFFKMYREKIKKASSAAGSTINVDDMVDEYESLRKNYDTPPQAVIGGGGGSGNLRIVNMAMADFGYAANDHNPDDEFNPFADWGPERHFV
ncbi:MAG: ketopantoate reductase family protein [Bdellovibrionales bacterium]